ncbi:high affinity copper uptake protein 1-like isoform X2 [Centruroides sculpturatus]|uniref:high affinity copper uptake protein 1-like isoform X1 n=1 Tax=Centruroides sculpturatus TaxID=218467 RepID=UPI000C6CBD11|nr:high affinity copper uptake protein 1-like isoform X1 [Centruroides sculpturatus]XP_023243196.1 high affinity copper uptake protein 1-like isoform X2 [Centruroides sculpturatus]XP_023243197.1 high affinity copper uptake protein 1-like isoform X2 [Centruroides sculpturatus]
MGDHHHGHGHGHMGHTSHTTINDTTMPSIMTTAATLLESVMTAMNHSIHHMDKEVSDPAKHVHHDTAGSLTTASLDHIHDTIVHDHGSPNGHMMMYFHAGVDVTILFEQWKVTTVGGLVGSIIGIFLLAMLYEGLKFFREFLFKQYFSSLQYTTISVTGQDGKTMTEIHKIARNRMISWPHGIQTILHVVQMVTSYFLMLIFMTYNVWLCMAVALGAGAGYFLFGWRKATVVDVTEHCH